MSSVSKASKGNSVHTVRAGRDAVSAVKFSQKLTAAIDAWAEAYPKPFASWWSSG